MQLISTLVRVENIKGKFDILCVNHANLVAQHGKCYTYNHLFASLASKMHKQDKLVVCTHD